MAAVAFGAAEQNPDYPGQCYDSSTNKAHSVGSEWPMKNACGRVRCEKYGTALYFSYASCPAIDVAPPCRIVADQNGPYPACCPRVECPPLNVNINEIPDDQIAMGSYDVTLEEDNQDSTFEQNYEDEDGFSNVFPLWRDFNPTHPRK